MSNHLRLVSRAMLTACCLAMLTSAAYAKPGPASGVFKPLEPNPAHKRSSIEILDRLEYAHYHDLSIDNALSTRVFDRYLKDLDPSRSHFLKADISEFEAYRYTIDDTLSVGDLGPGFLIYNRYQHRVIQRLNYMIKTLENGIKQFDFNRNDYIETKREDSPWAKSMAELEELWRKRLKGAVLGLKLTGKKDKDIQQTLLSRYRSNLTRAKQANSEDAFQTYMNALTQTYDPHTQYYSPRSSENFNINMSLSLEGIGAVLQSEDEYTKVVRLVPAGPADKAGNLQPADKIIGVAQDKNEMINVVGWRIDEVVELIRGKKNTVVRLEIIPRNAAHDQDTKVISITRNTVKLEEQAAKKHIIDIKDPGVPVFKLGVISIPTFYVDFRGMQSGNPNYKSTTRDVKKLIQELQAANVDGLIIDLRNNGGGALNEVNTLLGLFIESGPTVQVRHMRGRTETYRDNDPSVFYSGPLAVMVNRLSASASEIFAAAIQDYNRGLILGNQTFGKGTVQALRGLNKGQLKITQAKFYRISGGSNQNLGVIPDIAFPNYYDTNEIGESALENALPWDTIPPARYEAYGQIRPLIKDLTKRHQERVKHNPDFIHLVETIKLNDELRADTKVSLNEKLRKEQKKSIKDRQLALENKRRIANGEKPIEKLAELDEDKEKDENNGKPLSTEDLKNDVLLTESAHILMDYIKLHDHRVAKH